MLHFGKSDERPVTLQRMQSSDVLNCSGSIEADNFYIAGTTTTVADLISEVATLKEEMAAMKQFVGMLPPAAPPPPPPLPAYIKVGMGVCMSSQVRSRDSPYESSYGPTCDYSLASNDVTARNAWFQAVGASTTSMKWVKLEERCSQLCNLSDTCTGFYNHGVTHGWIQCYLVMTTNVATCPTLDSLAPDNVSPTCPHARCCVCAAGNAGGFSAGSDNCCPTANRVIGILHENLVNSCWVKTALNGADGVSYCGNASPACCPGQTCN